VRRPTVVFVTSTLPPTKPGLTLPTEVPPTASPTLDPLAASPTPSCRDSALFVEDVTYPDHTRLDAGEKFTKTWKIQNTGSCTWTDYTVAFVSGNKLDAPESVSVPETEAQSAVEISVDLVAPAEDGAYVGNFELRNEKGDALPLGIEKTFWVKIIVGEAPDEQVAGNCIYTENPEYVETLIELINKERVGVGRAALTINEQLTKAARAHSLDMACNSFLEHSGSDGSWTGDRVTDAGYANTYYLEIPRDRASRRCHESMEDRKERLECRTQLARDRDRCGLCLFEVQRLRRLLDSGNGRQIVHLCHSERHAARGAKNLYPERETLTA
jgi:uncharacterized protein YkwD